MAISFKKKLQASAIGAFIITLMYALSQIFIPNITPTVTGIIIFIISFMVAIVGMNL
jgi:hypothetical protein